MGYDIDPRWYWLMAAWGSVFFGTYAWALISKCMAGWDDDPDDVDGPG